MKPLTNALHKEEYYTYADYAAWELKPGERYEIIDGFPFLMAAPNIEHQSISAMLSGEIYNFLKGKKCRVFASPIDVCVHGEGDNDDTVVQPDIIVVCDRNKLNEQRCNGAPDIAIEIISPSSTNFDRKMKFRKYEYAGVREYWIVDPQSMSVEVCVLENRKYTVTKYGEDDYIVSTVLDGLQIKISDIFADY